MQIDLVNTSKSKESDDDQEQPVSEVEVVKVESQKVQRRPRMDKGKVRLGERDTQAMVWLGEMYAARYDHLGEVLGRLAGREPLSVNATRDVVGRWASVGLVEREIFKFKEPAWVWLTRVGLDYVGLDEFKVYKPSISLLEHLARVNQVRLQLTAAYPGGVWRSERLLKHYYKWEHFPDAEFSDSKSRMAIEIELSLKKRERLEKIVRLLAGEHVDGKALGRDYAEVWYFVPKSVKNALLMVTKGRAKFRIFDI
jgi:hypothetical protein